MPPAAGGRASSPSPGPPSPSPLLNSLVRCRGAGTGDWAGRTETTTDQLTRKEKNRLSPAPPRQCSRRRNGMIPKSSPSSPHGVATVREDSGWGEAIPKGGFAPTRRFADAAWPPPAKPTVQRTQLPSSYPGEAGTGIPKALGLRRVQGSALVSTKWPPGRGSGGFLPPPQPCCSAMTRCSSAWSSATSKGLDT